jgi:excisionase family DNA binding protein
VERSSEFDAGLTSEMSGSWTILVHEERTSTMAKNGNHRGRTLVSCNEAAALAGVSHQTIRRRIAAGELTGYRFGPKLIRVDLAEVEALIHCIPTVADSA